MRRITVLSACMLLMPSALTWAQSRQADQVVEDYHLQQLEAELDWLREPIQFQPSGRDRFSSEAAPMTMQPATLASYPNELFESCASESAFSPTIKIGGFFQADSGWFNQSPLNIVSVGDAQDGADIRRARLNARGNIAENVSYMVDVDFAFLNRTNLMDVWLQLNETAPWGDVRIGYFRQPIGLDALTSVTETTFLERNLLMAMLPFRQVGVGLHDVAPNLRSTRSISTYRFPTDFRGGYVGDNGGYGIAGRWTCLPFWNGQSDRLFHFGSAFTFADPGNDLVRYASPPEFFMIENGGAYFAPPGVPSSTPFFVDTGPVHANNFGMITTELAGIRGSMHYQAETVFLTVNTIGTGRSQFFGSSAQVGYFLTGEVKTYNFQSGVLSRITPRCPVQKCQGIGAWEVAARWSYLDLNDDAIQGGRLNDLTLGVNWYWNRNTRFQLNYIKAYLDDPNFGDSDAGIVALRAQIDF